MSAGGKHSMSVSGRSVVLSAKLDQAGFWQGLGTIYSGDYRCICAEYKCIKAAISGWSGGRTSTALFLV